MIQSSLKDADRMKLPEANTSERIIQFPSAVPSNVEPQAISPEQPSLVGVNQVLFKLGVEPS